MTESKTLEELKKEHFDWIDKDDIYVVNEDNLVIENDDKPTKLDFNDSLEGNILKIKYDNICHTFKCDIKFIIPFKTMTMLETTKKYDINKDTLKKMIKDYKTDLNRDAIFRKYYINNNLKNDKDKIKEQLNVSEDEFKSTMNISNKLNEVIKLYKFIFGYEIDKTKEDEIKDILLLKKLYKFLFNDELSDTENKTKRLYSVLIIMHQGYDSIFSFFLPSISNLKYHIISKTCGPTKRTMFIKENDLILKTEIPATVINSDNSSKCKDVFIPTIFCYINFTEEFPNYYMKIIFNDKNKEVYRKNNLTFKEEKVTLMKSGKIIFI